MDPARRRGLLVGSLAAALALGWAAHFEPFAFPNNDYYSFERAAQSFAQGELPSSRKRGPILPGLMALTAPLLPDPHPELRAALLWNLAFSLGAFLLLAGFAHRVLPRGEGWLLVLVACAGVLHAMALQPLVEPSLTFFVLLAFRLLAARSPWQYAAAAGAALSRPEGLSLLAALALVNAAAERRWLRHALLAALGALPFVAWNVLGAARGTGAAAYLELVQSLSLRGFALVGVHYAREGFAGWTLAPGALGLAIGAALAVLFGLRGARAALRDHPREAWAMLVFLALSALAIGVFGISKSRYVAPTVWIPLAFTALGVCDFGAGLRVPPRARAAVVAALCLPLAVGGLLRASTLVGQARDLDRDVLPVAHWLAAHLADDEKVAIVHTSQLLFATDLRPEQVVAYATFEADDPTTLRSEMKARGVTHAAWVWRRPAETPSQRFYDERKKVDLAAVFADADPPPGFELVATLASPRPDHPPARVHRLSGGPSSPARR